MKSEKLMMPSPLKSKVATSELDPPLPSCVEGQRAAHYGGDVREPSVVPHFRVRYVDRIRKARQVCRRPEANGAHIPAHTDRLSCKRAKQKGVIRRGSDQSQRALRLEALDDHLTGVQIEDENHRL